MHNLSNYSIVPVLVQTHAIKRGFGWLSNEWFKKYINYSTIFSPINGALWYTTDVACILNNLDYGS